MTGSIAPAARSKAVYMQAAAREHSTGGAGALVTGSIALAAGNIALAAR